MSDIVLAAVIGAVATVCTALGALVGSWYASRTSAKLTELQQLRERVDKLSRENARMYRNNTRLWEYITKLRLMLLENGLSVPPLPEDRYEETVEVVR